MPRLGSSGIGMARRGLSARTRRPPRRPPRRPWPSQPASLASFTRWGIPALVGVLSLLFGIGIGAAGGSSALGGSTKEPTPAPTVTVDPSAAKEAELDKIAADLDEIAAGQGKVNEELAAWEAELAAREQAVGTAEAEAASNTITDGTWTVGVDITPGTYRSNGASADCYWAITATGSNGADIIKNDLPGGGRPTGRPGGRPRFQHPAVRRLDAGGAGTPPHRVALALHWGRAVRANGAGVAMMTVMTPNPAAMSERERISFLDEVLEQLRSRHIQGTVQIGGREATMLWHATVDAFVAGNWLAALLCAQATCERVLAGLVSLHALPGLSGSEPKNWDKWGLGSLIEHARKQRWVEPELLDHVAIVCELRKPFGHWRLP